MVVLGHHFPVALTSDIGVLPLHVWIQVVTPQSVVATGVAGLIGGRHGDLMITTEGRFGEQPDIVFYDVIGLHGGDGADLDRWVSNTDAVVIALTHELRPDLGLAALDRGADAAVSIGASAGTSSRSSTRRCPVGSTAAPRSGPPTRAPGSAARSG